MMPDKDSEILDYHICAGKATTQHAYGHISKMRYFTEIYWELTLDDNTTEINFCPFCGKRLDGLSPVPAFTNGPLPSLIT